VRGAAALACLTVLAAACSDERPRPDAAAVGVSVHPAGILDPASDAFHGKELARQGWDFAVCARCHGSDFAGGSARTTCLGCHTAGPTACVTCHGAGPTSNAHAVHRDAAGLTCSACHVVPARWDDEGHLRQNGAPVTGPAKVTFGALAGLTLDPGDRKGPPNFDDGTCRNVYCHGDALHAAGGSVPQPRWDDPAAPGRCDRCHGAPPPSHAQSACAVCHPPGAPHVDGAVQVGRTPGCSGCHGDASSPAPPFDLSGNQSISALGVGAHRNHLQVPTGLRGPIPCATCHVVPTEIGSPGHIDSPPPAELHDQLAWDRTTATCGTAWCHGPARPAWTAGGVATCGSCHGIPPTSRSHDPGMKLTSCAACHPQTMDATGAILLAPGPDGVPVSKHMNGAIDVL